MAQSGLTLNNFLTYFWPSFYSSKRPCWGFYQSVQKKTFTTNAVKSSMLL